MVFIKQRWFLVVFLAIILLALSLRLTKVGSVPNGFTGDEAAFGYDAYAILHQQTDEFGQKLPVYFSSIGDYKYPAYVYLSVPLIALFGLNELSTRLLSVLAGTGTIVWLMLLVLELTRKKKLALTIGFTLAISPWHIFFSRGAYESIVGLSFSLGCLYFLRRFLTKQHKRDLLIALGFFVIGIYSYSVYRLLLPVLLVVLLITSQSLGHQRTKKALIAGFFLVLVFFGVSFISSLNPESRARAGALVRHKDNQLEVDHENLVLEDGISHPGKTLSTRMYHNKYVTYSLNILDSYLNHFNPDFLFINGDRTRHATSIPNAGILYLYEIPLLVLGFIYLLRTSLFLAVFAGSWLLIGAIPSALTNEPPNPVRFLIAIPAFAIFSGAGLAYLMQFIRGRKKFIALAIGAIVIAIIGYNTSYIYHQYTVHSQYYRPWYRDEGMKEVVQTVTLARTRYRAVVLPGDPYIFFLFYNRLLPQTFLDQAEVENGGVGKWERVNRLDNVIFKMPIQCPKIGKLDVLYVCKGTEIPQNAKLVHLVRFNDAVPAFSFIEFYLLSQVPAIKPELPWGVNYMRESDSRTDGIIPESEQRFW